MQIKELQTFVHNGAMVRGWYEKELGEKTPVRIASLLALIHSEVSEALEDVREARLELELTETGKPIGLPTELADIIIRTLDLAEWLGIDMERALLAKIEYNDQRPHRHGDKLL